MIAASNDTNTIYRMIEGGCNAYIGNSERVVVNGYPGCGKSFVAMWWILKHIDQTNKFLVLVPYRRLATQLGDLFNEILVPNLSAKSGGRSNLSIKVVQGMNPNIYGVNFKKIVISTYEHGHAVWKLMSQNTSSIYVVIDEIHNIFYPHRGWQLEPFFDSPYLLGLTGTLLRGEPEMIKRRIELVTKKKCSLCNMNLWDSTFSLPRNKCSVLHIPNSMSMLEFVRNFIRSGVGGLFFFCPSIRTTIIRAYQCAKDYGIQIINPISGRERSRFFCGGVFGELERDLLARNLIRRDAEEPFKIPQGDQFLSQRLRIYIDFSTHFDEHIREIISQKKECKLLVFCTTTLCEGLNLKSVKSVAIDSGKWDRRRVMQIQGRAGRFGITQNVFFGKMAYSDPEPLLLDKFDYAKVVLRGLEDSYGKGMYSIPEMEPFEKEAFDNVVDFIASQNYSSIESYLAVNYGMDIGIRFRDFEKQAEIGATMEASRSPIMKLTQLKIVIYNEILKPFLRVEVYKLSTMINDVDDNELQDLL